MTAWARSSTMRRTAVGALSICSLSITATAALADINGSSCPLNAIAVEPGASIPAAVDRAGKGAAFCLKSRGSPEGLSLKSELGPAPPVPAYGLGEVPQRCLLIRSVAGHIIGADLSTGVGLDA
jgi:hypothetical protein